MSYNGSRYDRARYNAALYFDGSRISAEAQAEAEEADAMHLHKRRAIASARQAAGIRASAQVRAAPEGPDAYGPGAEPAPLPADPVAVNPELVARLTRQFTNVRAAQMPSPDFAGGVRLPST